MILTWHLIKKDLRRLWLPLALFSLLLVGEILFYATIAGLWGAPDLNWLWRLFSGPEVLLRTLAQPLITYFFVGWLIFEDSPVEKDAHWITRPISGGQLLGAKLGAAVLALILWPLALNLLWWLACGCSAHEIAVSAREFIGIYFLLVSLALACAALTDGFPRFALWSFVGVIVFFMLQLTFNLSGGPAAGLAASRLLVGGFCGTIVALVIAGHQFITRRHRRSLVVACLGLVLTGVLSGLWRWDFVDDASRLTPESPAFAGVNLKLTGPVQLKQMGVRYFVKLPMKIADLPDNALVTQLNTVGDWSFAGTRVWTSQSDFTDPALGRDAIRRMLKLKGPAPQDSEVMPSLVFSPPIAQRAAHQPIAFHARVTLEVLYGRLAAELPLRNVAAPAGVPDCTISDIYYGPRKKVGSKNPAAEPVVVSLMVTERSARGFRDNTAYSRRALLLSYALVNRRTGELYLCNPVQSGPNAFTLLNQVKVISWRFVFSTGPVKVEELTLAVLRFDGGERVRRDLDINPVTFAQAVP